MHCWYDRAIDILKIASESADQQTRDCLSVMMDGDVAKFCFTDVPWNTAFEFGKSLAENGVLRLPYPRCYFQYGYDSSITGMLVSEFDTEAGLIWFIWRAMRYPDMGEGYGILTLANMTQLSVGSGEFIRAPEHFTKAAESHLSESHESNVDEALCCTAYLGFKGVETSLVRPKEAVNSRREQEGRPPLPTYRVVKVRGGVRRSGRGGSHATPAPHWRRGHVRILPSGKATVVRPHTVMGGAPKFPDYEV